MAQLSSRPRKQVDPNKLLALRDREIINWKSILLVFFLVLVVGLSVHFTDNIYYSNQLSQVNNQNSSDQSQLNAEQHDLGFVINNYSDQLNCYDLQSTYAHNLCSSHNNKLN